MNVRQAINIPVANWRLITSELPYVYSLCSDHHLLPVAGVIIDVFTSSMDQVFNDDGDDNNDGYNVVPYVYVSVENLAVFTRPFIG